MATLVKEQISNICQIISDLRGESTTNTGADRIRAISLAERDFAKRRFWRIHLLEDQTVAGDGTALYTLGTATYPMRTGGVFNVRAGGTTDDYAVNFTEKYDIANDAWKVELEDAVSAGTTIYYDYYYKPPKKTLSTEYVYCSDPMIIVKLALGIIYEGEEEEQKAISAKNEAEQLIQEASGKEDISSKGTINTMGVIEGTKGIGNY